MSTTPDAVLFDLFGVIARNQAPAAREALAAVAGTTATAPAFWHAYWKHRVPYDRGEVIATTYWHQVATTLGDSFDEHRTTALIAADIASWSTVDDEMITLVEHLATSGRRLALLSNIPEELAAYYEQNHRRWLRHFELLAFSCRTGKAKPDADAYLWCCGKLGLPTECVLFIDDRAENVHAAERLGMRAHLFTGSADAARATGAVRLAPTKDVLSPSKAARGE